MYHDQTISKEEKISIKNEIDSIKNKDLEKSIVNLGASINREDNIMKKILNIICLLFITYFATHIHFCN